MRRKMFEYYNFLLEKCKLFEPSQCKLLTDFLSRKPSTNSNHGKDKFEHQREEIRSGRRS